MRGNCIKDKGYRMRRFLMRVEGNSTFNVRRRHCLNGGNK